MKITIALPIELRIVQKTTLKSIWNLEETQNSKNNPGQKEQSRNWASWQTLVILAPRRLRQENLCEPTITNLNHTETKTSKTKPTKKGKTQARGITILVFNYTTKLLEEKQTCGPIKQNRECKEKKILRHIQLSSLWQRGQNIQWRKDSLFNK